MSAITFEQYQAAKQVTDAFEADLEEKHQLVLRQVESEIIEYFKTNKFDRFKIEKVDFTHSPAGDLRIVPHVPSLYECCEGDEKFDKFCKSLKRKFDVEVDWVHWVYGK